VPEPVGAVEAGHKDERILLADQRSDAGFGLRPEMDGRLIRGVEQEPAEGCVRTRIGLSGLIPAAQSAKASECRLPATRACVAVMTLGAAST
jgi:hypothetical protein